MGAETLRHKGRALHLEKATIAPDFLGQTVLVADPWDYVDLWLRRESQSRARFYWGQARDFAAAAAGLPPTSAPLLAYYSMLNAVKALLTVHKAEFSERHGVGGRRKEKGRGLTAEVVEFSNSGVFGALLRLLGESASEDEQYNLKQLLYNLVWVHRAFSLTYSGSPELLVPIIHPSLVRREDSSEAWFTAVVSPKDKSLLTKKRLPDHFEWDAGEPSGNRLREVSRFRWEQSGTVQENCIRLATYNRKVRRLVVYIHSSQWLWYLKRKVTSPDVADHSSLVVTYAAMHRMSELSRYKPYLLAHHLDAGYNWLLNEFINIALSQFVDEVAAEITGKDFMAPGARS